MTSPDSSRLRNRAICEESLVLINPQSALCNRLSVIGTPQYRPSATSK
jgi:hypothetical protein